MSIMQSSEDTLDENQSLEANDTSVIDDEEDTFEEDQSSENVNTEAEGETSVNYYTPEEFSELLKKGSVFIDRNRVSPEQLVYFDATLEREKAMQADYTRKTQEIAERQKQLEEQRLSPEEKFTREFFANPLKVRRDVENTISSLDLQEADALEEMNYQKVREIRSQKALIRKVLADAEEKLAQSQYQINSAANIDMAFQKEIIKDIPDFYNGKQEQLTKYLHSEGVDPRVQALFANPVILDYLLKTHGITDVDGVTASKQIIKAVNSAFMRANAGNTANQKEIKKPPYTGTSGAGVIGGNNASAAREKALKEGDIGSWADYLLAKSKG